MIVAMLLGPCVKIAAAVVVWRVACWTLGDVVMEHIGVPFLDTPPRRPRSAGRRRSALR